MKKERLNKPRFNQAIAMSYDSHTTTEFAEDDTKSILSTTSFSSALEQQHSPNPNTPSPSTQPSRKHKTPSKPASRRASTISTQPSRPANSHLSNSTPNSRRNSTAPTSLRSSRYSSRRSSLLRSQTIEIYSIATRPQLDPQRRSTSLSYATSDNPFLAHLDFHERGLHDASCGSEAVTEVSFPPRPRKHAGPTSRLPTLYRAATSPSLAPAHSHPHQNHQHPPHHTQTFSNFYPASNINWSLPSTHEQTHRTEKASCLGVRQVWKQLVTRTRLLSRKIFDVKGGDRGSVRRSKPIQSNTSKLWSD